jgi:hypothetical protein
MIQGQDRTVEHLPQVPKYSTEIRILDEVRIALAMNLHRQPDQEAKDRIHER